VLGDGAVSALNHSRAGINAVSPPWVKETLINRWDSARGLRSTEVAKAYIAAVGGTIRAGLSIRKSLLNSVAELQFL